MPLPKQVGVSTTQTIEGWEIEEYLGPVVVHTVAGSGLVSDWLAGWSDVFGGRSGTYGKQLRSLSDEAIQSLRVRAGSMKANWVLGVTVDMDEISGQGKQMFMVTAMGTAVRARRTRGAQDAPPVDAAATGRIDADQLRAAERRRELLLSLERGAVEFTDETWATLMAERPAAAVPFVVAHVARLTSEYPDYVEQARAKAVAFLERLDPADASRELHALLDADGARAELALGWIVKLYLRDLSEVRRRLSGPPTGRPAALQLLRAGQQFYEAGDADTLLEIAALCTAAQFPTLAKVIPGKGGLFGGGDSIQCMCGETRGAKQSHCSKYTCQRDVRGFRAHELAPEKAREYCTSLAGTLLFTFGSPPTGGGAGGRSAGA